MSPPMVDPARTDSPDNRLCHSPFTHHPTGHFLDATVCACLQISDMCTSIMPANMCSGKHPSIHRNRQCTSYVHIASCGSLHVILTSSLSVLCFCSWPVYLTPLPQAPPGLSPLSILVCLPLRMCPSLAKCFSRFLSLVFLYFTQVRGKWKDMVLRLWPFTSRRTLNCGPCILSAVPTSRPPD